ncbi:Phage antitermination protein Q [Serratia odorifera]|uniref:Phage antitermination protein Q n=1 Tax=Serratia odorifera TaxID=618 RepID=A0A447KKE0_SEROD|nr:Phage antitermination protein Q [Serratia odorifera]
MKDMYEILERWGVWAREDSGIDYSPIAAGFKGYCHQHRAESYPAVMMMVC